MKSSAWITLLAFCISVMPAHSQDLHLFRAYEDDDFFNIAGKGTDKGYTNGSRLDYFYLKSHPDHLVIDKFFPRAGTAANDTYSFSLMQLMFTPKDISTSIPDKTDWPYSGALFVTHGLHSFNPTRQYSIESELTVGVMGPLSLAKQTQTWFHSLIGYTKPEGWQYQLPNDILLNLNVQGEKMIWSHRHAIELMGGGRIEAGTLADDISINLQFRIGHMEPYFNGYIPQYASGKHTGRHRLQYYLFASPYAQWWGYDALLQGGVFAGKGAYYAGLSSKGKSPRLHQITAVADIGATLVVGNLSLSFIQRQMSALLRGIVDQTVGNVSLTWAW